ncbi:MAG: C10 family peptidase, partial [Candidatus Cloacimonetes bacterium]|nr:C10 family peptidase [Candidatus Cloacimonadota bacterium]
VSTSMIMKYWNHPANGEGTNSYDDAPYGTITADFENTHYNWAAMSNTLILTGTQQLLFHSGVAMNMDYGTFDSYAPISNAFTALINNFRYDATAQLVNRQDYTDATWEQLLKNELNNARPILYKADTANGEIGFVIDGWQNGNEFHVNWGDEGNQNGYYTLDALAFNGVDMTAGNAAVIGIYPSLGPVTVDENFEGDFSGFNWQFSGDSDWSITPNAHFYGVQAAKSGQINHNQSTSIFIEIDVLVDDVISFIQRVSCENSPDTPTYDYLSFWIDDQEMDRWDGDSYWEYEEYPVTAGVHTFKWTYQKDGATIEGQDCAWIDAIDLPECQVFTPADFEAIPTQGYAPLNVLFQDLSLGNVLSWQWDFENDGIIDSSEQNPTHLFNTAGVYSVSLTVTNSYDFTTTMTKLDYITVLPRYPELEIISNPSLSFGTVYLGSQSIPQNVWLKNIGTATVIVDSLTLELENSPFEAISTLPIEIEEGDSTYFQVSFTPQYSGNFYDHLTLYNNSINLPISELILSGTGDYVPPQAPQAVTVIMNGYDAVISWNAVTETIYNTPVTPDYYFVFYNGSSDIEGQYYFHGLSTTTQYIHASVGLATSNMFYRVVAILQYRNNTSLLGSHDYEAYLRNNLKQGMTEEEIMEILLNK